MKLFSGKPWAFKEWVIPQDREFFDSFEKLAEAVVESSDLLLDLVDNYTDVKN